MRALTLTQPWCGLVASGIKLVENRPRPMIKREDFGSPFGVHAGGSIDQSVYARIEEIAPELFEGWSVARATSWPEWYRLSRITGAVIAVATVGHVIDDYDTLGEILGDQQRWYFGPIGYVLRDVGALATPVKCPGAQPFWHMPRARRTRCDRATREGRMTAAPDQFMIDHALRVAALSPCRSKRGVALYDMSTGAFRGEGFNGPPAAMPCPGRSVCAGSCGKRSVHAETRALRNAAVYTRNHGFGPWDLVHVELGADGGVVACAGPSCWQCAREILDVGFVGGVWLYLSAKTWRSIPLDQLPLPGIQFDDEFNAVAAWGRYTANEFYRVTLESCGMVP